MRHRRETKKAGGWVCASFGISDVLSSESLFIALYCSSSNSFQFIGSSSTPSLACNH